MAPELADCEAKGSKQMRASKQLACVSCRRKKVKCQPDPQGSTSCALCTKLGKDCYIPEHDDRRRTHTRRLIADLQAENERLKLDNNRLRAELDEHLGGYVFHNPDSPGLTPDSNQTSEEKVFNNGPESVSSSPQSYISSSTKSDNMIMRLCDGQRQLNSDRVGRLRFFGPTSSLHLRESITSSILIQESQGVAGRTCSSWQDDFPLEVQNELFDLYWTYQHQVLPCIHKEAFLRDMNKGDTKYCSTLLVYCILTRAAAISSQPGIRALALADDADDDPPYLVRKCVQLLETELDAPGITTAQSLQLLSEMHCAISHDTKGWMYAGGAGRLAYELGLHRDSCNFETNLSDLDQQVRRVVFWSTFNLDREWALYLGRPQFLKLEDIDAKRPGEGCLDVSSEVRISAAWTSLLEIIGRICEILNGVHTPRHRMETLDQGLRDWKTSLDLDLQDSGAQAPPIVLLHMQYSAALILLHRPLAQFGKGISERSSSSEMSRRLCVEQACCIADHLQQYHDLYGSVMTMSWIALHIVATAATTLIANIAERRGDSDVGRQLESVRRCLGTLNELEKSHVVTRRVRKVIQHAIRLLNLDATINSGGSVWQQASNNLSVPVTWTAASDTHDFMPAQLSFLDLLPVPTQFDMLNSFESYFS